MNEITPTKSDAPTSDTTTRRGRAEIMMEMSETFALTMIIREMLEALAPTDAEARKVLFEGIRARTMSNVTRFMTEPGAHMRAAQVIEDAVPKR